MSTYNNHDIVTVGNVDNEAKKIGTESALHRANFFKKMMSLYADELSDVTFTVASLFSKKHICCVKNGVFWWLPKDYGIPCSLDGVPDRDKYTSSNKPHFYKFD